MGGGSESDRIAADEDSSKALDSWTKKVGCEKKELLALCEEPDYAK